MTEWAFRSPKNETKQWNWKEWLFLSIPSPNQTQPKVVLDGSFYVLHGQSVCRFLLVHAPGNVFELPKKFVRLYGKTLSSSVCLRPRCGSKWKIGLEKREDKVWLCQGWPEFAKLYALDFGHFLFFKYKGNSQFYVSICDISACEIHYPSIPANLNDPNVYVPKKEKTIGYDESLQMLDSSSSEEKYIPPSSPPQKRTRTNASGECQKEGTHHIRKVKTECTSVGDSGIHSWGAAEVTRSQHRQGKGVAKKGKYGKFQSGNHTSAGLRTLRDGKAF